MVHKWLSWKVFVGLWVLCHIWPSTGKSLHGNIIVFIFCTHPEGAGQADPSYRFCESLLSCPEQCVLHISLSCSAATSWFHKVWVQLENNCSLQLGFSFHGTDPSKENIQLYKCDYWIKRVEGWVCSHMTRGRQKFRTKTFITYINLYCERAAYQPPVWVVSLLD